MLHFWGIFACKKTRQSEEGSTWVPPAMTVRSTTTLLPAPDASTATPHAPRILGGEHSNLQSTRRTPAPPVATTVVPLNDTSANDTKQPSPWHSTTPPARIEQLRTITQDDIEAHLGHASLWCGSLHEAPRQLTQKDVSTIRKHTSSVNTPAR